MLDDLVCRHARQQHAAHAQVDFRTVLFANQGIRRLLNLGVQEFVGALQAEDEPGVDGFQSAACIASSVFP
jgi:hypothetical protein